MLKVFKKNYFRAFFVFLCFLLIQSSYLHSSHSHEQDQHEDISSECATCLSVAQFHTDLSASSISVVYLPLQLSKLLENTTIDDLKKFWSFSSIRGPPFLV